MKISYDYGHLEGGQDTSANGIVYEYAEIRKYGPVVVNELMRQGHTLIDCTPPNNMTLNESLAYRVNKANASGSELHLCFHVNAFNGQGHGAECEVASDNGQKYGESILKEICKLGFSNRGVKRPSLYITKNTNMVAVLIEPFFCDNASDVALYNPNTLGKAIAQGVINIIGGNAPQINIERIDNMSILEFQKFFNTFNIPGYAKLVEDGIDGRMTQGARAKLKSIFQYILA